MPILGVHAYGQKRAVNNVSMFWHNGGMSRLCFRAPSITCEGFGDALRPQRGGARGSHFASNQNCVSAGESEGESLRIQPKLRECRGKRGGVTSHPTKTA